MKWKIKFWPIAAMIMAALAILEFSGCKTPTLEPGGAYAPIVQTDEDVPPTLAQKPDLALFIADSGHKLAFDAIDAVFKFELDNRAQLLTTSPKIKAALDAIRPKVWDAEVRWAKARAAYKANPIPANLTAVQQVLAEIQRLVPVVQSQLSVQ